MGEAKFAWELLDAIWESMVGPFLSSPAAIERDTSEVDGILSLTGVAPTARVLDLGCGKGRHALELARRGFSVTGVDRTAQFVDQARQHLKRRGWLSSLSSRTCASSNGQIPLTWR